MGGKGPCPKYFIEICASNIFEILGSLKSISMHYCRYLILKATDIFWIYTLQIFIRTVVRDPCILIAEQINNLFFLLMH